jgi:hypothetical protein
MLKKFRKSSGTVTLVLIGLSALAGCSGEKRDVYASKEDCLADWGNKPEDCSPATDPKHASRGFYYGPLIGAGAGYLAGRSWSSSHGSFSASRAASRASGSSSGSSSRGGFGSTGRSSSSSS